MIELVRARREFPVGGSAVVALDHLDLEVAPGTFLAVVGRSGSGKSTLLHLVAGLDRPTSGRVRVAGTELAALDEDGLAAWRGGAVGVVFQSFQLLPTLTVLENVLLPMELVRGRGDRARGLELLDQVGVADQAHKLPATLSGGQQQRAAIARALANDPPLVVADEPTGNLDSRTADVVIALLAGLAAAGRTVVLVTHDRDRLDQVDRVVELADGRLVEDRVHARVGAIHG
jgi:putative ABC transport system ATP-binding protein